MHARAETRGQAGVGVEELGHLRGLGPNHSLVLLDGRRLSDYPIAYNGSVNAVNLANVPSAFVDKAEVLTGSAGAVYGSDAVAGVVNIKLKERQDGLDLSLRGGTTDQGGGRNFRAQAVGGQTFGALDLVLGGEITVRDPLFWGQRRISESYSRYATPDQPQYPPALFSIRDPISRNYFKPEAGTCEGLSSLQGGTVRSVTGKYGTYCGSDAFYSYRTIQTQKHSQSFYGRATYHVTGDTQIYASGLLTQSEIANLLRAPSWSRTFYNLATSQLENWSRTLAPEETGGAFGAANHYAELAWNGAVGARGKIGNSWHWDVSYDRSDYRSDQRRLRLLSGITRFFLGPRLGVEDGFPVYDAPASRLYTPLTVSDFGALSAQSTSHNLTRLQDISLALNGTLLQLPAGPLAAAIGVEAGANRFVNTPDPLLNTGIYFGAPTASVSAGSRRRQAIGGELRAPVLRWLTVSGAGRYDRYRYAGRQISAATYGGGVEVHPTETLLIRGSLSSSFRAPDMNYVFETETRGYHPGVTDYYQCRLEGTPYDSCTIAYNMDFVETGNPDLKPERGRSLTAGIVWAPNRHFDLSIDYYRIRISDEVTSLDVDELLKQEADCRLGASVSGSPVDPRSNLCVDYLARVDRVTGDATVSANQVTLIRSSPINAARETTSGLDASATLRWAWRRIGDFTLTGNYNRVLSHTYQQFADDPVFDWLNTLAYQSEWKSRGNASLSYSSGPVSLTVFGVHYGRVPRNDYFGSRSPYTTVNVSGAVDVTPSVNLALSINNVANRYPIDTSGGWPWYSNGFYDIYGRQFWLKANFKIGKHR